MSYQNINQFVSKKWFLTPIYNSYDISLASDEKDYYEEVIFSNEIIANNNGNKLPINIDLNHSGCSQQYELNFGEYSFDNIVVSKNVYNPNFSDLSVNISQELCDIGLTGIDNGLVTGMTGQSITISNGVNESETFNRYYFDKRFKMFQVTGYTSLPNQRFSGVTSGTSYEMVSYLGPEGIYNELYGGFYQGFFKLFGYDYEVLPQRMNKGWSVEMLLKPRLTDYFEHPEGYITLNELYPNNSNIFFYLGTRAENKFYHLADGFPESNTGYTRATDILNCLKTCSCSDSGVTNSNCIHVYQQSELTEAHGKNCSCGCVNYSYELISGDKDPLYDGMSNAIALKLCGDPKNPKIGVRVFSFTGDCVVTGTTPSTGITYTTGYTITDHCSDNGIYDFCEGTSYVDNEHWFLVDVVWERNTWFDTCDLYYKGGLGIITKYEYLDSLTNNSVLLIKPNYSETDPEQIEIVNLNEKWLLEKNHRKGKLKIYINGKIFYTINDVEEIIPRGLNTEKEKQLGVPFNISWGGGTLGLHENLTFSSCENNIYTQDPECFPNDVLNGTTLSGLTTNIMLEQNFAGSFDGGISQFRFYIEPLNSSEIKHNFKILNNTYYMFNPDCPNC